MKRTLALAALVLAVALGGCATRLRPGTDGHMTWDSGPKWAVGLGDYAVEVGQPSAAPTVESVAPALNEKVTALEAKAATLEQRLADPNLPPEARAALEAAKAKADAALADAAEAKAKADAVPPPERIPWEGIGGGVGGLMAIAFALAKRWMRKAQVETAEKAIREAEAKVGAAIAAYDAAPYTPEDAVAIDAARQGRPATP